MGIIIRRMTDGNAQRERLYAAEHQVKAFLRDLLPTIAEMQGFVDGILRNRWIARLFWLAYAYPDHGSWASDGGGSESANAHCFTSEISMSKELRSKFVVIHEVCHILTDRFYGQRMSEGHGPEFATFELMLVNHFLGAEDCQDLLGAFARCGVAHSYRGEEDGGEGQGHAANSAGEHPVASSTQMDLGRQ